MRISPEAEKLLNRYYLATRKARNLSDGSVISSSTLSTLYVYIYIKWCVNKQYSKSKVLRESTKNAEKQSKTDLYKNDICTVTTSTKHTIDFFSARSSKRRPGFIF